MRSIIPPVLLTLATVSVPAASPPALAQQEEGEAQRTITVVGHGEVEASPDTAVVELAVETTAESADQVSSQNARLATRVIEAVKGLLGDDDRVTTTGYSLQPRYAQRKPGSEAPPEITGYIASNQVRIETHDLEKVGEVIDAGIAAGANRTTNLRFTLEERGPHLREALREAGEEARAQAESIAATLGVALGEVLAASTAGPPVIPSPRVQRFAVAMEVRETTPVEPGEVRVSATLNVTYRIRN